MDRRLKKWKKFTLPGLVLLGALLVYGLLLAFKSKPKIEHHAEKQWLVNSEQIYPSSYTPTITLYGSIESPHTADIVAAVSADVKDTPVYEGDEIKKDQLILLLDDQEAKLALQERQAEVNVLEAKIAAEKLRYAANKESYDYEKELLEIAKRNVERRQYLSETQAGSKAQLDDALKELRRQAVQLNSRELEVEEFTHSLSELEAQLQKAQALAARAQLDLKRTKVYAPFSGKVAKLLASVGERVEPGEPLIKVYDVGRIEVRAQIPTTYLPRLQKTLELKDKLVAVSNIDGEETELELVRLSGEVGRGRAGIDALFKISKGDPKVSIGRTIKMECQLPELESVYAAPLSALYDGNLIYKIVNGKLEAVSIVRAEEGRSWSTVLPDCLAICSASTASITNLDRSIFERLGYGLTLSETVG